MATSNLTYDDVIFLYFSVEKEYRRNGIWLMNDKTALALRKLKDADGKYQYKYHIDGKPHFVYSWRLEPTDKLPKGKKPCLSLRELEKQVNTDLDILVNIVDGQMTVCELVD